LNLRKNARRTSKIDGARQRKSPNRKRAVVDSLV
jgi:hypothetical protein